LNLAVQWGYPGGQRFRETLRHEDHIHNQIEVCRQSLNRGDPVEVMNSVESLLTLITPKMEDDEFLADLQGADDDWQKELAKKKREYLRRVRLSSGGCPDLIEKPNRKPGIDHWKKVYMIALSLFERKGLMLKVDVQDEI
jgi:hypothetical protein